MILHVDKYKGKIMAINKTATLTFRIAPELKEALREAAAREHRSIANMVEVLIRHHCKQHELEILEQEKSITLITELEES